MTRRGGDGAGLLAALRAAVDNLAANVDEVNALNVFPVPDGDTGTNMLATVRAALAEAESVTQPSADRVAQAISFGALMGARGNSGVIASQIFRGMADGLGGKSRFNGADLAHALTQGTATAYKAVAKPVEGTILTVVREAAAAAVVAADGAHGPLTIVGQDAAEISHLRRSRLAKRPLCRLQIDGLRAFGVRLNVERYALAFRQRAHARHFNGRGVNKHVLAAAFRGNEAKTLGRIEEFYCSDSHDYS